MAEPSASFGIAQISPALSARLREVADFLAAPVARRLTDEQRATILGIARRLMSDLAGQLGGHIDSEHLWVKWSQDGIPDPDRLALLCFSRAEEYRWRHHSSQWSQHLYGESPLEDEEEETGDEAPRVAPVTQKEQSSAIDLARLALSIADRRRLDVFGHPRVPLADLDALLYQSLLVDIAAAALVQHDNDPAVARRLGTDIRQLIAQRSDNDTMDAAVAGYHAAIEATGDEGEVVAAAIRGNDWVSVIAAAAGHHRMRYDIMALRLLSANVDDLRTIFAPLGLGDAELAPLMASLETIPHRHIAPDGQGMSEPPHDVYSTLLKSRAATFSSPDNMSAEKGV